MKALQVFSRIVMIAAVAMAVGFAPAATADDDDRTVEKKVHRIKIKTDSSDCDGEDCADHHAVYINKDGEAIEMEGGDFEWVSDDAAHGSGPHRMMKMLHGAHKGGFLGIQLTDLTPELRAHFGVPEDAGVMVSKVVDDSPAARAGLAVGDIIALIDNEDMSSAGAVSRAIGSHEEGDVVTLEVWREGRTERISATLEERERPSMAMMPRVKMMRGGPHGMHGEHGMGGDHQVKVIKIQCDDGSEDCAPAFEFDHDFDFGCAEGDACEVKVQCGDDGDCECTVNGESTDCAGFPGVPHGE